MVVEDSTIEATMVNSLLTSHGFTVKTFAEGVSAYEYAINSERKQIPDLLLSVYETSIEQNKALVAAQRQLQEANEQLGLANRDLEAFSYTISHDLRTPLNHIGVSAQLIKERHEHSFDAEDKSYLETILGTVRSMSEMIQDLLQFSRSGDVAANLKPLDLTEMTQQIAEWIRQEGSIRQVDFTIEKDMQVMADSSLLMVVMKNLLGNAWKYTSRKPSAKIEIGTTLMNGHKTIFVKDNGAGFDCHKAWNLFTPFVRLHSQDDFPGTGVGLATVRRIIERHGGKIWAEAIPDEGATFYFTLPE